MHTKKFWLTITALLCGCTFFVGGDNEPLLYSGAPSIEEPMQPAEPVLILVFENAQGFGYTESKLDDNRYAITIYGNAGSLNSSFTHENLLKIRAESLCKPKNIGSIEIGLLEIPIQSYTGLNPTSMLPGVVQCL